MHGIFVRAVIVVMRDRAGASQMSAGCAGAGVLAAINVVTPRGFACGYFRGLKATATSVKSRFPEGNDRKKSNGKGRSSRGGWQSCAGVAQDDDGGGAGFCDSPVSKARPGAPGKREQIDHWVSSAAPLI